MTDRIRISPELSAQGVNKRANPMLRPSWTAVKEAGLINGASPILVDYGCGQLRNVATLLSFSSRLVLVDTKRQLTAPHDFDGSKILAAEFVKRRWPKSKIQVLTTPQFESSTIRADVIFVINVFDVVTQRIRGRMLDTALQHLKRSGGLVIVAPRNDFWTLRLCKSKRSYEDGFAFNHPRGQTFYKNWEGQTLQKWARERGLVILRDISCYRQVCLVCKAAM